MTIPASLATLSGNWHGTNQLWLSPEEPARESESTAEVALVAQGKFVTIRYTWADEGQPQDGMLSIGQEPETKLVSATWIDSWHMDHKFMFCEGNVEPDGTILLKGSYAAPPGPNWGWQIVIEVQTENTFRLSMYNISPDDKRMLAVQVAYSRQL